MNDISITEKYALFVIKEKKTIVPGIVLDNVIPTLVTSMVIEMMLDGNIIIDEKNRILLANDIPKSSYNKYLYDYLKDTSEELSLRDLMYNFFGGINEKHFGNVINLLKEEMISKKLITSEEKNGLFGKKEVLVLNNEMFVLCLDEMKKEILNETDINERTVLLISLLTSINILKKVFSKYELERIEIRLKTIDTSEIAKKVKLLTTIFETEL